MSDSFEKFVKENREQFDNTEPKDEVWSGIQSNLRPSKKLNWQRLASYAAAAVLVAALSVVFIQNQTIQNLKSEALSHDSLFQNEVEMSLPLAIKEAEAYYKIQVAQGLKVLAKHPSEEEEVRAELQELDDEYESLKNELGKSFTKQDIIEAMIENYRLKLEILETTLEHIKRNEDENKSTQQYS